MKIIRGMEHNYHSLLALHMTAAKQSASMHFIRFRCNPLIACLTYRCNIFNRWLMHEKLPSCKGEVTYNGNRIKFFLMHRE